MIEPRQMESVNGRSVAKQEINIPSIQSYLGPIRSYIKSAYKTYLLLNAEVKLGQCVVKHLYTQYPSLMRFFRIENLTKLIRRAYYIVVKFITNMLSRDIFASFGSEADRKRVESKVALIMRDEQPQRGNTPQQHSAYYDSPKLVPNYNFNYKYLNYFDPVGYKQIRIHQRFKRQASRFELDESYDSQVSTPNVEEKHMQSAKATYIMNSEQFNDNVNDNEGMDFEAQIDLTNKTLEREADELFNIDSMFWKSLGIDESSIKKYSPVYCGKNYFTDVFKRFVKNVISN